MLVAPKQNRVLLLRSRGHRRRYAVAHRPWDRRGLKNKQQPICDAEDRDQRTSRQRQVQLCLAERWEGQRIALCILTPKLQTEAVRPGGNDGIHGQGQFPQRLPIHDQERPLGSVNCQLRCCVRCLRTHGPAKHAEQRHEAQPFHHGHAVTLVMLPTCA